MRRLRYRLAAATFVLVLAGVSTAEAQRVRNPWLLEGYAGIVLGTGTFADLTNAGIAGGAGAGYAISRRVWLMGNIHGAWHPGADNFSDWSTYSVFGMVGFSASRPRSQSSIIIPVGVGAVAFDPRAPSMGKKSYFAVTTGVKFYYYFAERAALSVVAMVDLAFTEKEFLGSSTTWLFPLAAGIAVRL